MQKSLEMMDQSGSNSYLIDEALWEKINERASGSANLCFQCGECTAVCPWGIVKEGSLKVRSILRGAQLGVEDWDKEIWLCTNCIQCQSYCPRGVQIGDIFQALRSLSWENREVEPGLPSMLWSIYWNDNPWSQPPSERFNWARGANIPEFDCQEHEFLLYIGCTSAFDNRLQKVAQALARVLTAFGVSFGCLGVNEPCCGESIKSVGHNPYFRETAESTARIFTSAGVRKLMTLSPHCYDVFKNHYRTVLQEESFEVFHYTQVLAELLENGKVSIPAGFIDRALENNYSWIDPDGVTITFQDPCYLGRRNNEFQAPRTLILGIPGINLIEMENHMQDGLCCGGGGGRMWLETPSGERFSDIRIKQALETGASILATACPFCLVCLEDSLNALGKKNLFVLDIAEIVDMAIGQSG
ncbi:MAG: (Fe-S)-binding protein [Anaerolineales bacterium]|jgi:Fe-S oxidoreductase